MPRTKKEPIPPEEFLSILQGLEILHIDVDDFAGKVLDRDRDRLRGRDSGLAISLNEKQEYKIGRENHVTVWHTYGLTVTDGAAEGAEKLMTLTVKFRVTYISQNPFTADFFEQFKDSSLRLQTVPFARAWVHDHCLRMGVPVLIMPLLRVE